jgi:hypothetical protein
MHRHDWWPKADLRPEPGRTSFGTRGSQVQILPLRPMKSMTQQFGDSLGIPDWCTEIKSPARTKPRGGRVGALGGLVESLGASARAEVAAGAPAERPHGEANAPLPASSADRLLSAPAYSQAPALNLSGLEKRRAHRPRNRGITKSTKPTSPRLRRSLTEMPRSIRGTTCVARVRHAAVRPSHDGHAGKLALRSRDRDAGASVVWRAHRRPNVPLWRRRSARFYRKILLRH